MFLLRLFEWLGQTSLGIFMQQSNYAFALVEMIHLLSLAILGGAILIVDLRLLGIGLNSQQAARLSQEFRPYLIGSLWVSVVSGVLLLSSEPLKCYYSPAFRLKMLFLMLAVLFYFTVQQRLVQSDPRNTSQFLTKLAAIMSLTLWLAVGLAGRAIGLI